MRNFERMAAFAMMVVAAVVFLGTWDLEIWSGFSPGDRFMPVLVSIATALLAVAYFVEAGGRPVADAVSWPRGGDAVRIGTITASVAGFALAATVLGFVVSSALFVAGVLVAVTRRPVVPSLVTAVVTTGIVHGVFVSWLGVRLPIGVFGF